MRVDRAIAVFCPSCLASAGEPCRDLVGLIHGARYALAIEGERKANADDNKEVSSKNGEQEANAERHACRAVPSNGGKVA